MHSCKENIVILKNICRKNIDLSMDILMMMRKITFFFWQVFFIPYCFVPVICTFFLVLRRFAGDCIVLFFDFLPEIDRLLILSVFFFSESVRFTSQGWYLVPFFAWTLSFEPSKTYYSVSFCFLFCTKCLHNTFQLSQNARSIEPRWRRTMILTQFSDYFWVPRPQPDFSKRLR